MKFFLSFFVTTNKFQNMFLAIINDTYSEVKAEVNARKEAFQVKSCHSNNFLILIIHLRTTATCSLHIHQTHAFSWLARHYQNLEDKNTMLFSAFWTEIILSKIDNQKVKLANGTRSSDCKTFERSAIMPFLPILRHFPYFLRSINNWSCLFLNGWSFFYFRWGISSCVDSTTCEDPWPRGTSSSTSRRPSSWPTRTASSPSRRFGRVWES